MLDGMEANTVGSKRVWDREVVTSATTVLLDQVRAGRGGALFVVGEPGLGKTTILDQSRERAVRDFRIVLGCGDAMETSLPFGLLAQAANGLRAGHLLHPLIVSAAAADSRAVLFSSTLQWLESMTAAPALVALDDLHWADADSMALLSFLCRRISSLRVAVIGTLRPWPSAAHETAQMLGHGGHGTVIRLEALSEEAASALLVDRVGHPLQEEVRRRAWTLSGGNPLLLEQLALAIGRGEHIPELGQESLGGAAADLLLPRFSGLPAPGLRLAKAATVMGLRFRVDIASVAAQLSEDEIDGAIESLCLSGLVRATTTNVAEFVHPLFWQALYEDLEPPLRARLHARVFTSLATRGLEAEAVEHAIRAELAGNTDAIVVLERAGRAALAAGALSTAVNNLKAAVRFAGGRADPSLLRALGDALLAGGQLTEAIDVYERLLRHGEASVVVRAEALRMLGRALFASGNHSGAGTRFEQAVELAGSVVPAVGVQALLDHALAVSLTAGPAGSVPLVTRARELASRSDATSRHRADAAWGFIALQAGNPAGVDATAAAARAAEVDPLANLVDLCWSGSTFSVFGLAASFIEWFSDAERTLNLALLNAEQVGAVQAVASLSVNQIYVLARLGRIEEGLALLHRVKAVVELVPVIESFGAAAGANLLLHAGRVEESAQWYERGEALASAREEWWALLHLWDAKGQRCLREGRLTEACELYASVEATTHRMGIGEPCMAPWARHAIAAYLACDRVEDAARVVDWVKGCAERLPCRWPRIVATTGGARLAEHAGDRGGADTSFRAAVALHDLVELPLEKVETLIEYGAFLRRAGQPVRARPVLAEALTLAEGIGSRWLARHALEELRIVGGRRRRRTGETRDQLTNQEKRVAHFAARGRSNQEIAGQLSLSVKTVDFHLQQVYGKLGIHSRRELMLMWRPRPNAQYSAASLEDREDARD
jgi:DNA-binding CsgD family transcriptional regulator